MLAPGLVFVALLIRIGSPGPAIFRQERIGQNSRGLAGGEGPDGLERRRRNQHGRPFEIYKFRTMHASAEEETGPVLAADDDPRATPVGKLLRKFRIDEIPQLFNVIKGEMSLVGPRPERAYFIHSAYERIPGFQGRFQVRPGITGLAQLENGYDHDLDSFRRKIGYDLAYVRSCGIRRDLAILLKTIPVVTHLRNW